MTLERLGRRQAPPVPTARLETTRHIYLRSGLTVAAFAAHLASLAALARVSRHSDERQPDDQPTGRLATADSLFRALASSHRFRQDTALGAMFHRRSVSFRELSATNSLHVVFHRGHVSAHVDRVSPLNLNPDRPAHYSLARVLAHNALAAIEHLGRMVANWSKPRSKLSIPAPSTHDHDHMDSAGRSSQPLLVPFSIIDEAVHLLDAEAAPWSIQLELRVTGHLDETRVRGALADALARHPMARARKKASRLTLRRDAWQIPPCPDIDPVRVIDCPDDAAVEATRAELQSLAVPLVESPPLRLRLVHHPDGDLLMLNVNHAAMDGFGALRVLRSLARAYVDEADPVAPVEFEYARDLLVRLARPRLAVRLRRQLALIERLRDVFVPPARLAGDGGSGEPGYGFYQVSVPRAATQALIDLDHGGTVNDVLLATFHLTIAGWNAEHGARCGRIGVLVPANLRPAEWRNDIAGNFSLPARVSTSSRHRRSAMKTLEAVTVQTNRKKRVGFGTAMIELLGRSRLFPLWAKHAMVMLLPVTGNRLVDTAMLSNLGRLDPVPTFGSESGDVSEVWFSPPARMPLGLSVGAATVNGRLHLAFRYRNRLFGPEAAQRFAERYVLELGRYQAPDPAGSAPAAA
jgi:NRPS condensation-like uncharacterized protein